KTTFSDERQQLMKIGQREIVVARGRVNLDRARDDFARGSKVPNIHEAIGEIQQDAGRPFARYERTAIVVKRRVRVRENVKVAAHQIQGARMLRRSSQHGFDLLSSRAQLIEVQPLRCEE